VSPRAYDFHGLRLAVDGWAEVEAVLHARLASLPAGAPEAAGPDGGAPDGLRFELRAASGAGAHELAPPPGARPVYDPPSGRVLYAAAEDLLWLELEEDPAGAGPRFAALCEPAAGRVRVSARRPAAGSQSAAKRGPAPAGSSSSSSQSRSSAAA